MTRPELFTYVGTLAPEVQQIFHLVYSLVREIEDTGREDFQVAADVLAVFERRAEACE